MTTQEAYEAIRTYFETEAIGLAKDGNGACQYRTDDGQKCAVGCLIPDEVYSTEMEWKNVTALFDSMPYVAGYFHGVDRRFLADAQVMHDSIANDRAAFVRGLDFVARAHGLEVPW